MGEIDRDRVDPDPHERHGPLLKFPDLDNLIEHGEKETTVTARHQDVGGSPNLLDDRELETPQKSDDDTANSRAEQPEHLPPLRYGSVF